MAFIYDSKGLKKKVVLQTYYNLDGDYILFAGKGHEEYQLVCGKRIPFSERKILEELDVAFQPI